jgi:hypothetical protein
VFAKCDISIKYNLIEYKGQWITSAENKKTWKVLWKEQNTSCLHGWSIN